MPFFAPQRANFTACSLANTPVRAKVVDYTQPIDPVGYTFIVKKTPTNEGYTKTSELAVAKGMHFVFRRDDIMDRHFKASNVVEEKWIYTIAKVSGSQNVLNKLGPVNPKYKHCSYSQSVCCITG